MTRAKDIFLFLMNLLICLLGLGFFIWLAMGLEEHGSAAHRFFEGLLRSKWLVIGGMIAAGVLVCLPVVLKRRR